METYMQNERLDAERTNIKRQLIKEINEHFENPYCAGTKNGKVMYQKEILEIINNL